MATVTAIAFNVFEKIGFVPFRVAAIVRGPAECADERKPLRMQWVREVDSDGRMAIRIRLSTDNDQERTSPSANGANEDGTKQ